jgi:hypothetical protein
LTSVERFYERSITPVPEDLAIATALSETADRYEYIAGLKVVLSPTHRGRQQQEREYQASFSELSHFHPPVGLWDRSPDENE